MRMTVDSLGGITGSSNVNTFLRDVFHLKPLLVTIFYIFALFYARYVEMVVSQGPFLYFYLTGRLGALLQGSVVLFLPYFLVGM